jgi:hypothetical protein
VNHHDILHFLNNQLDALLYDVRVPLARHQNMWLQLDGAPVHHAIAVQNLLNANFPRRWIGRNDRCYGRHVHQILPHLTFFFWGHMKSQVYDLRPSPESREELLSRINAVIETVTQEMLNNIHHSLQRRVEACLAQKGNVFEHSL